MPHITGLPKWASFEMKKALTAAAANYGSPLLWADGHTEPAPPCSYKGKLTFTNYDLQQRYDELAPKGEVDLVVIGCPQASLGEIRSTAAAVRTRMELGEKIPNNIRNLKSNYLRKNLR